MKVLVINGSPNKDGNTAALVKAFAEGAESSGNDVVVKWVGKMKINGCMACMHCKGEGKGKCIQKDDFMTELYPEYQKAEVVVLASPVYYFGMTAQTTAALQRVFCMGKPPGLKKAALLLSSGSPGVYTGAIATYKDTFAYLGAEDVGIVTANGTENKSEAKLKEAKALGAKIKA